MHIAPLYKHAHGTQAYPFEGMQHFGFSLAAKAKQLMLHLGAFLFFLGYLGIKFSINNMVGQLMLVFMSLFKLVYLVVTLLLNVWPNCPYGPY